MSIDRKIQNGFPSLIGYKMKGNMPRHSIMSRQTHLVSIYLAVGLVPVER